MYIGRRPDGSIYGSWACPQHEDADHPNLSEVKDDDTELLAFLRTDRPVPVDETKLKLDALESRLAAVENSQKGENGSVSNLLR